MKFPDWSNAKTVCYGFVSQLGTNYEYTVEEDCYAIVDSWGVNGAGTQMYINSIPISNGRGGEGGSFDHDANFIACKKGDVIWCHYEMGATSNTGYCIRIIPFK